MRTLALAAALVINVGGADFSTAAALVLGNIDNSGPSWPHFLLSGTLLVVSVGGIHASLGCQDRFKMTGRCLLAVLPLTVATALSSSIA